MPLPLIEGYAASFDGEGTRHTFDILHTPHAQSRDLPTTMLCVVSAEDIEECARSSARFRGIETDQLQEDGTHGEVGGCHHIG